MGFTEKSGSSSSFEADAKKLEENLQKLDNSLDEIFSVLNKKITFDEFCESISNEIDAFIPKHEQSENVEFIGGNCVFKITGFVKKCSATADLYFRNSKGEFTQVTMNGALPLSKFTEESVKTDLAEVSKNKELKVDIEHP